MGGKVLEKLLINRINHTMYKHNLLTDRQFGFTPQKSTMEAAMEAKIFIQPVLENGGLVIRPAWMSMVPLTQRGGRAFYRP